MTKTVSKTKAKTLTTMARRCRVEGCELPVNSKTYCWLHYGRWRRNGDPLAHGQQGGHNKGQGRAGDVPDPAPLHALRSELQQRRAQGYGFSTAWTAAIGIALHGLPRAERASWREVLTEHEAIWRAAYAGEPLDAVAALAVLAILDDEHEPRHRRTAPALVLHAARADGESQMEPIEVPWCRA